MSDLCSICKRSLVESGPLVDGLCKYCAEEVRCYVCGGDGIIDGDWGRLCGGEDCKKADGFRSFRHYSKVRQPWER
jgi:hypothetical protein